MNELLLLIILVILLKSCKACTWPEVDALFILDSTPYVTSFQHQSQVDFYRQVSQSMKMGGSRIALSQFTPGPRVDMALVNSSSPESRIQDLRYCPCEKNSPCPQTSINSLMRSSMTSANRKSVPDVVLVVSNSYQPLVEVLSNEPLISPISPLHVFYIVVGSNMHISRFEPSANTVGMKVTDFEYLPHLVSPICQSVNGYIKGSSSTRFGPLCWIIIAAICLFAILLLAVLAYAIYSYQEENRRLRFKLSELDKSMRKQNEYFTAQLHSQMQKQIVNGEKHAEEMKKQADIMQTQLDRQLEAAYQHANKYSIPIPVNTVYPEKEKEAKDTTIERERRELRNVGTETRMSLLGEEERRDSGIDNSLHEVEHEEIHPPNEDQTPTSSSSSSGSDETEETEIDEEELNRVTHLPKDHPARKLPPVDLMFLVDTSSSIGINNFDIQKNFICEILKDVDIAPGRSRIALIQYAQDPSVVFGFDQFYSYESVRRGVMRLNYTGGATMLSKALAFAGGIMYHEQNMKKTSKKHQYLPTPKHDRPQILCLVSDGYSDDSADKESILLHDRLHIKIFAVVTRSFNKSKLVPITRFEGSVFTIHQRESIAIWMWRQQKIWAEHYTTFIEKERKQRAKN